jgi:hypothetical protein
MQMTFECNPQLWRLRAREMGECAQHMSDSQSRRILLHDAPPVLNWPRGRVSEH